MRKLLAVVFGLLILTPGASLLRAQSGRTRTIPTAEKPGVDAAGKLGADARADVLPGAETKEEVADGEVIRVDTSLVTVPVSVRDRSGRYAPDLRREDFKVFEDGVEHEIAYFAAVDQPFTVALVIDTSGSTDMSLREMQDAALSFVAQLRSADRVTVVSFDERIDVLAEPTNDRAALTRAIRRTHTGGGTRLYDAVDFVIRQHLGKVAGRKAVVLFTDGVDTTSRRASRDSTLRLAEESDALIYPVAYANRRGLLGGTHGGGVPRFPLPGGRGGVIIGSPFPRAPGQGGGTSDADYARGDAYLNELAMRSGGRLYRSNSVVNVSQAFAWVAEELRRQYSLGYYPKAAGRDGQRRRIKVQVSRPELVVQARDAYIYTQKKSNAKESDARRLTAPNS